jgi:hypothetical protein
MVVAGVFVTAAGIYATAHLPSQAPTPDTVSQQFIPVNVPGYTPAVINVPAQPGLVPVSEVTYGPDYGEFRVDPTFSPPHPLPPGLGISLSVGNLVWGAGDPRASTLREPFSDSAEKELHENIVALLQYVRTRVGKFNIKPAKSIVPDPALKADGPAFTGNLLQREYSGESQIDLSFPPPGKDHDPEANRIFNQAADNLIDQIQGRLRGTIRIRTEMGPQ